MNKAEKKFRIYSILVIFVLLTVLLAVINGVNFTMASGDADTLTRMIAERQGSFGQSDPGAQTPPESQNDPGAQLQPEPGAQTPPESQNDPGAQLQPGIQPEPGSQTSPELQSDPGAQLQPGVQPEPGAQTPPELQSDPGAQLQHGVQPEPGAQIPPESQNDPGALSDPAARQQGGKKDFRMGPMGPDSPEMNESLRYFTVAFSGENAEAETVAYRISAVTEEEAAEWAKSLVNEKTGWTRWTYRYRVYKDVEKTYVTVIDQGRELLPSFRILIISAAGEALVLIICWFVLLWIARKIYAPLEEADRQQKNFVKNANKEFRIPLTVISGNTELTERKYGPDDQTRSTRRQVAKMNGIVDKLGTFGIFEDRKEQFENVPLSEIFSAAIDRAEKDFRKGNITLTADAAPDVTLSADPDALNEMISELIDNALKYALTKAAFRLNAENGHVILEAENDTSLQDGSVNQVFDRFTTLQNAKEGSAGLGLSRVKEIVKAHNGRATAEVKDGMFLLRVTL